MGGWVGNIKIHLGEIGLGEKVGLIWLRIRISGGRSCEYGSEPSSSIKCS
jgi:hypothetical protein